MARTEEQIAADDALTAVIERVARAYGVLENSDVMNDYVVVAATQELREDELINSYIILLRNNSVPGSTAVGLLETSSFDIKMGRHHE
jgi:hypothetical protein